MNSAKLAKKKANADMGLETSFPDAHLGKHACGTFHPIHNTNHKGITLVTFTQKKNLSNCFRRKKPGYIYRLSNNVLMRQKEDHLSDYQITCLNSRPLTYLHYDSKKVIELVAKQGPSLSLG